MHSRTFSVFASTIKVNMRKALAHFWYLIPSHVWFRAGDRQVTLADLPSLPYLTAVVNETLRMYPPIPVFPREAEAADQLPSGHVINAGDVIFMSSYSLGRSPRLWEEPSTFDPERFSPDNVATMHKF